MAEAFDFYTATLRGGATHNELNEAVEDLARAVMSTNKPGSVSFTITIKPDGGNRIMVTDKVVLKSPEFNRAASMFFIDESGKPSRKDPNQMVLEEFRDVLKQNNATVKAVSGETK